MTSEPIRDVEGLCLDPRNWGAEPERQPVPEEDDTVLYSECGRILNHVDCRSHSFKLVKNHGQFFVLVRHGGGDERISLGYSYRQIDAIFAPLESDLRYWLLHSFMDLYHDTKRAAIDQTADKFRKAFVDGRLKKRKLPAQGAVKVWIEPETERRQ